MTLPLLNSKSKNDGITVFLISGFVGIVLFIIIYGVKVLNVTDDTWIIKGQADIFQHYIGWKAYRNSSFSFPIGLMDRISYPNAISVLYTDSIPLFAVFFKVLSPILPKTFQYFGIWSLLCYFLQGGFSSLIVRKFTDNKLICIFSSLLFILSPALLQRTLVHSSLSAHFIILAAILLWLCQRQMTFVKRLALWSILSFIAAFTHVYFILMVGLILIFSLWDYYITEKNGISALFGFFCYIAVSAFCIYILGGFSTSYNSLLTGFGDLGANLGSFFNPTDVYNADKSVFKYSLFLPYRKLGTAGQFEGFCYLGLGNIVICAISLFFAMSYLIHISLHKDVSDSIKVNSAFKNIQVKSFALGAALFLTAFIVSTGFSFYAGDKHLFTIGTGYGIIHRFCETFRSTGRFIWISYYLLITAAVYVSVKSVSKKLAAALILCSILLQVVDMFPVMTKFNQKFIHETEGSKEPFWTESLPENQISSFVIIDPDNEYQTTFSYYKLTNYALDHNIKTSSFLFARGIPVSIRETLNTHLTQLEQGVARKEILYIFPEKAVSDLNRYRLYFYWIDDLGLFFGSSHELSGMEHYLYTSY